MGKKVGVGALLLVAVFVAGFLPEHFKRSSAESLLKESERKNREAEVRDLASLAYVQAAQKNYGMAAQTSGQFFSRLQPLAAERAGTPAARSFDEILGFRDKITAGLAKGDPGVLDDIQTLYLKTRAATVGQ
jgi:hypothetical protein